MAEMILLADDMLALPALQQPAYGSLTELAGLRSSPINELLLKAGIDPCNCEVSEAMSPDRLIFRSPEEN